MKKYVFDFLRRGFAACGLGPIVLAVFYLTMQHTGSANTLTIDQVCLGIFSLSVLAFIAGGMNVVYQIEQLPLMMAIMIHGSVLYVSYLATYLLNGWLEWSATPILVFSRFFVLGYLLIWAIIYSVIKKNTDKINEMLKKKQQCAEE